jgi:hypothetical protein
MNDVPATKEKQSLLINEVNETEIETQGNDD